MEHIQIHSLLGEALCCAPEPLETSSEPPNTSLEESLQIIKKRYEIAIQYADVILFDYLPQTNQIIHSNVSVEKYGLTPIIENALESVGSAPGATAGGAATLRTMYERINAGEPFVQETIRFEGHGGTEIIEELTLTSIFDKNGKPTRAIGVAKDVSKSVLLEKETQYGQSLSSGRLFTYEADITTDRVLRYNQNWVAEMNIEKDNSFSRLIETLCQQCIYPSHVKRFKAFLDPQYLLAAYNRAETLLTLEYRKKLKEGIYRWYEKTINIIQDVVTGDITVRCYIINIDDKKRMDLKAQEERKFYEFMVSKAILVYEANITMDEVIRGHESWEERFGIEISSSYSEMIDAFIKKAVHPDEREKFAMMFRLENVKNSFRDGITELYCEYRRPNEQGDYIWVSCTMHLLEDSKTRDIKCFAYVENIHAEKLNELKLIYKAEHDELTGFYNKLTTQRMVDSFFKGKEARLKKHAFFLIDIDCFKQVNDNFGHIFGDAVLSQVAGKLHSLFREDDILGRIGGDEFVILMKNVSNSSVVLKKAQEICSSLWESYTQRGTEFHISASIGIAFYKKDGRGYDQLYSHSDYALYAAKANGRNQYCEYKIGMELRKSVETDIARTALLEPRLFHESMVEYVFRILYESTDKENSINAVLELIGKHFNVSRAYVFEDSSDHLFMDNTYEWCNQGVEPQLAQLQHVSHSALGEYKDNFDDQGIFFMPDVDMQNPAVQEVLKPQNVKSMLQFSITRDDVFWGFVGFDQCGFSRVTSPDELASLRNIANIIGVFTMEMRILEKSSQNEQTAMSIVNGLSSYAYVCDPKTYRVLFINQCTSELAPSAQVGDFCYRAFWNRNSVCDECPMRSLLSSNKSRFSLEMHNHNLGVWVRATASWIHWLDNKNVCLVDSYDITKYKQNESKKQ